MRGQIGIGLAALAGGLAVGMLGVVGTTYGEGQTYRRKAPAPPAVQAPVNPTAHCGLSKFSPFDLELAPAEIVGASSGETLRSDLIARSHLKADARIIYETELVTDLGEYVRPTERGAATTVSAGGERNLGVLDVPPLPAGYYLFRVTAALLSGDDEGQAMAILYLRSSEKRIDVIDVNDFYVESRAKYGVEIEGESR